MTALFGYSTLTANDPEQTLRVTEPAGVGFERLPRVAEQAAEVVMPEPALSLGKVVCAAPS